MKVVINKSYGGFGLSDFAEGMLRERWPECPDFLGSDPNLRANRELVSVVEELGSKANGFYSELKVVDVPDDAEWHIEEYDGLECVAEDHRTWG